MEVLRQAALPLDEPEHSVLLVDQAKGLTRAVAMKNVVGPALTEFFQPVYEPFFSAEELERIPADSAFPDLSDLVWGVQGAARKRLAVQIDSDSPSYIEFEMLRHAREDIFFNFGGIFRGADFKYNLEDSVNSGIMIPMVAAVDILRLESGDQPDSPSNVLNGPFKAQSIIDIMRRDSFALILSRLAKGPNNFITSYLSDPKQAFSLWQSPKPNDSKKADVFFGFRKGYGEYDKRKRLTIWDAYRMQDGEVVDLSYDYFQSAEAQRQQINKRGAMVFSRGPHRGEDSSGCPVRHKVDGYSESLITANKNFIIAALEVAERKTAQAEVARLLTELTELTESEPEVT
jgi:hypothetical protein